MTFSEFLILATACAPNVHPVTLNAIIEKESGFNEYAIGVNFGNRLERQPQNLGEAIETAKWLLTQGYNFDAGLGQINSSNFEWLGLTVETVFDPCKNLEGIQKVLQDCYARAVVHFPEEQDALRAALSCYNTGSLTNGSRYADIVADNRASVSVPEIIPKEPVNLRVSEDSDATKTEGLRDAFDRQDEQDAFTTNSDTDVFRPFGARDYSPQRPATVGGVSLD